MDQQLEEISARLRTIRRSKKLTLADIEKLSKGALHAISLGSYERGDRALTIKKAIQIAAFYEIPLAYLLTGKSELQTSSQKTIIDLRRLKTLVGQSQSSLTLQIIISFIGGIIKARQDFNGELLSLRETDCEYLTISIGCTYEELREFLNAQALLISTR
jgi:transcriptional regulator with XRE-family HTH domain